VKLVMTRLARRDMDAISAYTLDKWGREQLHDYVGGLLDNMDELAANPNKGGKIPSIPKRFQRLSYRAHFIFYTAIDDELRIIRILHQRIGILMPQPRWSAAGTRPQGPPLWW
jgi:toxin ParE1/3/4